MEFIERIVPANFNLFFFGDIHIGTLLHYEEGFDHFIDMLIFCLTHSCKHYIYHVVSHYTVHLLVKILLR